MYDFDKIKDNYRNFPEEKILKLAMKESRGLLPEVLVILKEEIIIRNLDKSLISWIDAETKELTDYERQIIFSKIENVPCPSCKQDNRPLNGYKYNQVISIIIDFDKTIKKRILCRKCGNKMRWKSIFISFIAGWWSIGGLLITPLTIIGDLINILFAGKISQKIINEFIEKNIGRIRLRGTGNRALISLINNFNNRIEE
jgi:hypothetical protein